MLQFISLQMRERGAWGAPWVVPVARGEADLMRVASAGFDPPVSTPSWFDGRELRSLLTMRGYSADGDLALMVSSDGGRSPASRPSNHEGVPRRRLPARIRALD
jgi:hypothetical protein